MIIKIVYTWYILGIYYNYAAEDCGVGEIFGGDFLT